MDRHTGEHRVTVQSVIKYSERAAPKKKKKIQGIYNFNTVWERVKMNAAL